MTRIIESSDLNDLIDAYQAGATPDEIGKRYGVQGQSVRIRLKKAGCRMRTIAEAKALHLPPVNVPLMVKQYRQGRSINALAKRVGRDRNLVIARLLANGVQLRTQSEQETLKWAAMSQAQRDAQVRAAHIASPIKNAGQKPSLSSMIAKSIAWEVTGRMNPRELLVSQFLTDLAIPHTAQRRVGTYNIDMAINELPIAVEVVASVPSRIYGPKLRKKVIDLLDGGWFILFVYMLTGNRNRLERISEQLPSWLERARVDQSVFGRYGVIRCDSKHGPILRPYLDGQPTIDGPRGAVEDTAHDCAR